MIATRTLLNTSLTPRTLLRRLLNTPFTSNLLRALNTFIRSIIVLCTCLATMPGRIMVDAMRLSTRFASEPSVRWIMYLARFAASCHAPSKIGNGFACGLCVELVVATEYVMRSEQLDVIVLHVR